MPRVKKEIDPNITPDGIIRSCLRMLFLRSRERSAAIRRDKNTCQTCSIKGSVAKGKEVKIEIHHVAEGDINWKRLYDVIREELLCPPERMISLCRHDHLALHGKTSKPKKEKKK